jgi:molybdopterin synthase catalytic subunit
MELQLRGMPPQTVVGMRWRTEVLTIIGSDVIERHLRQTNGRPAAMGRARVNLLVARRGVALTMMRSTASRSQHRSERGSEHRVEHRAGYRAEATTERTADAPEGDTWVALSGEPLPVAEAAAWVVRPDCGAVALFSGTARDHSAGRPSVHRLTYEAYDEYVEPVFEDIARAARQQWPELGRIVIWHRTGEVALGDSAVVVAVSAPHRPEAFAAARHCIDEVKKTAPIWKREDWAGGTSWGMSEP